METSKNCITLQVKQKTKKLKIILLNLKKFKGRKGVSLAGQDDLLGSHNVCVN